MDQDAGIVEAVIGVAADVTAPVDDQNGFAPLRGDPFCQHASGEARPDDEPVEHAAHAPTRRAAWTRGRATRDRCADIAAQVWSQDMVAR